MSFGVPKEVKDKENRVGMTPGSVSELVSLGETVYVETEAGVGIGCSDEDYQKVGATILPSAQEVFEKSDVIVKVKEPQLFECEMLRSDQVLFTYLHLAPDEPQTEALMKSGCTAIAYETITDERGGLPLLAPMSAVAGRMSVQAGAHALERAQGGRGVLLGGVPGVPPANVLVIGGGVVGLNAITMAIGMEANVTVVDKSLDRLAELNQLFGSKLNTIYSTQDMFESYLYESDLVIGAVLVAGAAAPKLVTREMLRKMRRNAVIVDVSIDQGGCFETSRPTTHSDPIYEVEGIVHYCVSNMPGAVSRTSTFALNNATLPYILAMAKKGCKQACLDDPHLMNGVNVHKGKLTNEAVAIAQDKKFVRPEKAL